MISIPEAFDTLFKHYYHHNSIGLSCYKCEGYVFIYDTMLGIIDDLEKERGFYDYEVSRIPEESSFMRAMREGQKHKTYRCEVQVSKHCRLIEEHQINFKGKNVCVACYSTLKDLDEWSEKVYGGDKE